MEDFHERRLSERLKKAPDYVEKIGGREKLAERLRQTYEMALEEEAQCRPNRRAAYRPQESSPRR